MNSQDTQPAPEETTGLCPQCLIEIPALVVEIDGQVWLEKTCPRHGASRALLASDAAEYWRIRKYVPDRSSGGCCGVGDGCDNGAPPVCVLLLEITQACNLQCPTCFAAAHGHDFMTIDEARRRLDTFFAKQPRLDLLMLSGGEPTIHPQFAQMLDLALSYPVDRVLINTNGLRLLNTDIVLDTIAAHRDHVELYLSYSSFRGPVHQRFYGRDLREEKRKALERAQARGVLTTLAVTVERGVNDDELGELYRFALAHDNINGITFQPVMSAGRYDHDYVAAERFTLTDTLRALQEQTDGALLTTDFVGLPCSHPDCCALTYGFLSEDRTQITPLPRHLDVARYMDLFSDRISFSGLIGSALRRIWSDLGSPTRTQTIRDLSELFAAAGIRDFLPLVGKPEQVARRVMRLVVKPFMDAHTYDSRRIEQCCTKIVDETGEAISLCQYNIFRRGKRPERSGIALTMAGTKP